MKKVKFILMLLFMFPLLIACYIDMIFNPKKYLIVWKENNEKIVWKSITGNATNFLKFDDIGAYQFKPHNKFLREFWDLF